MIFLDDIGVTFYCSSFQVDQFMIKASLNSTFNVCACSLVLEDVTSNHITLLNASNITFESACDS